MPEDEPSPALPFDAFAARVAVLDGDAAADLRACHIARFVDTTPYYQQHIAHLTPHSDGWAYDGYLWDSLISAQQMRRRSLTQSFWIKPSACSGVTCPVL